MRRLRLAVLPVLALASSLLVSPPAGAAAGTDVTGFASATSGIALGADGNYWVAERFANSVVRVSPAGQVLGPRIAVGGAPVDVAAGPGGTVWVTVPSGQKLVRIDAANLATYEVSVGPCAPTAVASGDANGRIYYSCPAMGTVRSVIAADGAAAGTASGLGEVYDLEVAAGQLFAPSTTNDVVYRIGLGATPVLNATYSAPAGSSPYGVTSLGNDLWVTLASGSLARVARSAANGTALSVVATSVPLSQPFGIAPSPFGTLYVAGTSGLVEVTTAGAATAVAVPAGAEPLRVAPTSEGALVTDNGRAAVIRVVDGKPTLGTPAITATGPTTATVTLPVDSHGNATTWRIGAATGQVPASAAGATTVTAFLTGLMPGTKNQLALSASNARGEVALTGFGVTTPAAARATYKAKAGAKGTKLRKLVVRGLAGGETVKVSCKGGGCPVKKKSYAKVEAGSLKLSKPFKGALLAPGAKVTVVVSRDGAPLSRLTLKVRVGKAPKETRS